MDNMRIMADAKTERGFGLPFAAPARPDTHDATIRVCHALVQ